MRDLMKLFSATLLVGVLSACGDDKAPKFEPVAVKSVAQQNQEIAERLQAQKAENEKKSFDESEAAERQRMIGLMRAAIDRWFDAFHQVAGKSPTDVAALARRMKADRNDMEAVPTSACTDPKRAPIVAAMDTIDALLAEFLAARSEVSSDFQKRMDEAYIAIERAVGTLSSCV